MTGVGVRLLLVVVTWVTLFTSLAEGERRAGLHSGQGECGREEVEVRPGQEQWLVSPGHAWPGVANGSQQTCLWTVKAPPGYGVMVEFVRLRLRRSRRCSASRLEVVPAGSITHPRARPLAKFCGRIPKTKLWKTTFSEINIKYRQIKGLRGRGRHASRLRPHSGSREGIGASSPSSQAALDRAERLKRIKSLHRLYQQKNRQNRLSQRHKNYEQQSDSSRYYQQNRGHELSGSRRFYRHLDSVDADHSTRIGNDDFLIDGDRFMYDLESNTYGITTTHRHSIGVRLLRVGEPASFNSNFVLHSGGNDTNPEVEYYFEDIELERDLNFHKRHNTSKGHGNQDHTNNIMESSDESVERYRRSPRDSPGRLTPRQHTVTAGSHLPHRQQYILSLKNNQRHHQNPAASSAFRRTLHSSNPYSRGRNEIIPNKPAKPTQRGGSHELKKIGYDNSKMSSETHNKRGYPHRLGGGRRRKKGEYFVLKVSAFRSKCGGEVDDVHGWFSNPEYPHKSSEKSSCSWKFKTPSRSHWKLICNDFLIRKSRDCRRDHLAIRINDGRWSRYCGREGPSLALTSSHHASVDVILNTFRNRSSRVMCSWETSIIDERSSHRHLAYDRYWSYNLTVATTTTTSTTTTTTTTTTPPPPIAPQGRSCHDYIHLTADHTMCRSTPSSCALYQEGVKSSDRSAILESHNRYRAKVARGEEGQGLPGPQYSASDMQQLAWNEELAQVAQAWASACPDYHDCHDCRKLISRNYYVGQNIFYEWSSTNAGSVWDTAVRLWYEEVKYVPNYLIKNFRSMDHAVIGHYTQLVWAESREVGCGAAYHDCSKVFKGRSWKLKCKIYVCNYGPTGNYLNKPMYTIGPAASACPTGSRPSVQYPGLCTSH